jgi:hypothetical protein
MVLVLPLQPLIFYLIRVPFDRWLVGRLGAGSVAYKWLITLYAPLTEEPVKLLPLLVPIILHDIRPRNFVRYALAIGFGFAVGEMWFVAERVARDPALADLPCYQFGGYFTERLMTCVFHSAFVSMPLWQLRRRFAIGLAGGMILHWLGNFPISLMAWNVGGLGKMFWTIAVQVWLMLYFLAAAALLSYFAFGRIATALLLHGTPGARTCCTIRTCTASCRPVDWRRAVIAGSLAARTSS